MWRSERRPREKDYIVARGGKGADPGHGFILLLNRGYIGNADEGFGKKIWHKACPFQLRSSVRSLNVKGTELPTENWVILILTAPLALDLLIHWILESCFLQEMLKNSGRIRTRILGVKEPQIASGTSIPTTLVNGLKNHCYNNKRSRRGIEFRKNFVSGS